MRERGSGLMSEHSLFDDFRVAYYHVCVRMRVRVVTGRTQTDECGRKY